MKCKMCGSENAADSKFCYNCGALLEADAQSAARANAYAPVQPVASAKPQKQKRKKDKVRKPLYPSNINRYSCFLQFVIISIKTSWHFQNYKLSSDA